MSIKTSSWNEGEGLPEAVESIKLEVTENSPTEGSNGREETPATVVRVRRKRVEMNLAEFRNLCLEAKIHMFILLHNITHWKCSRGCVLSTFWKHGRESSLWQQISVQRERSKTYEVQVCFFFFALLSFVLSQILNFVWY